MTCRENPQLSVINVKLLEMNLMQLDTVMNAAICCVVIASRAILEIN